MQLEPKPSEARTHEPIAETFEGSTVPLLVDLTGRMRRIAMQEPTLSALDEEIETTMGDDRVGKCTFAAQDHCTDGEPDMQTEVTFEYLAEPNRMPDALQFIAEANVDAEAQQHVRESRQEQIRCLMKRVRSSDGTMPNDSFANVVGVLEYLVEQGECVSRDLLYESNARAILEGGIREQREALWTESELRKNGDAEHLHETKNSFINTLERRMASIEEQVEHALAVSVSKIEAKLSSLQHRMDMEIAGSAKAMEECVQAAKEPKWENPATPKWENDSVEKRRSENLEDLLTQKLRMLEAETNTVAGSVTAIQREAEQREAEFQDVQRAIRELQDASRTRAAVGAMFEREPMMGRSILANSSRGTSRTASPVRPLVTMGSVGTRLRSHSPLGRGHSMLDFEESAPSPVRNRPHLASSGSMGTPARASTGSVGFPINDSLSASQRTWSPVQQPQSPRDAVTHRERADVAQFVVRIESPTVGGSSALHTSIQSGSTSVPANHYTGGTSCQSARASFSISPGQMSARAVEMNSSIDNAANSSTVSRFRSAPAPSVAQFEIEQEAPSIVVQPVASARRSMSSTSPSRMGMSPCQVSPTPRGPETSPTPRCPTHRTPAASPLLPQAQMMQTQSARYNGSPTVICAAASPPVPPPAQSPGVPPPGSMVPPLGAMVPPALERHGPVRLVSGSKSVPGPRPGSTTVGKPTVPAGAVAAAAAAAAAAGNQSPPASTTVRGGARPGVNMVVRPQPSASPAAPQPQRLTSAPVPHGTGATSNRAPQTLQQSQQQPPQQQQVGIVTVNGVAGLQAADFPRALSVPAMHRRLGDPPGPLGAPTGPWPTHGSWATCQQMPQHTQQR